MTTNEIEERKKQLDAEIQAAQDERARQSGMYEANRWMRDHRDYLANQANSKMMDDWLKSKGFVLSYENLDKAFNALGNKLARSTPLPAEPAPAAPAVEPTEEEKRRIFLETKFPLPPEWPLAHVITKSEIHLLDGEAYKRFFHAKDPWGKNFRDRVDWILQNPEGVKS
jgi:hypothetical protein